MKTAYSWYFPPAMIPGAIAVARAAVALAFASERVKAYLRLRRPQPVVTWVLVILALGSILAFIPASVEQRVQQLEIEEGNRSVVGTWLKENGKPTDTVYLEPLGYIGYYSGMQMRDFPGLVAPEVVKIRRQLPTDAQSALAAQYLVLPRLKPDWVVLRPIELSNLDKLNMLQDFQKEYSLAKEFNVEVRLRQYEFLPGRRSLEFDSSYSVFRRNASSAPLKVN
jgi:hypothetical protein